MPWAGLIVGHLLMFIYSSRPINLVVVNYIQCDLSYIFDKVCQ